MQRTRFDECRGADLKATSDKSWGNETSHPTLPVLDSLTMDFDADSRTFLWKHGGWRPVTILLQNTPPPSIPSCPIDADVLVFVPSHVTCATLVTYTTLLTCATFVTCVSHTTLLLHVILTSEKSENESRRQGDTVFLDSMGFTSTSLIPEVPSCATREDQGVKMATTSVIEGSSHVFRHIGRFAADKHTNLFVRWWRYVKWKDDVILYTQRRAFAERH